MLSRPWTAKSCCLTRKFPVEEGAIIEGTVVAVDDDEIAVNVGGKSDYTIPLAELTSEKVESAREIVQVGEKIKSYGPGKQETRRRWLSKRKAEEEGPWQQLKEKRSNSANGCLVKLSGRSRGGLQVNINGLIAFLPASHADLGYVKRSDHAGRLRSEVLCD